MYSTHKNMARNMTQPEVQLYKKTPSANGGRKKEAVDDIYVAYIVYHIVKNLSSPFRAKN